MSEPSVRQLLRESYPFPPEQPILEISHGPDFVDITFPQPMTVSGLPTRMGICSSEVDYAPLAFEPPIRCEVDESGNTIRLFFNPASFAVKRRFFVKSFERNIRFPSGAFVEPCFYQIV